MPNINKESVQKILSILNNHGVDKINIVVLEEKEQLIPSSLQTNRKIY